MAVILLVGLVGIVCVLYPEFFAVEVILIGLELFYLCHYYFGKTLLSIDIVSMISCFKLKNKPLYKRGLWLLFPNLI